MQADPNIKSIPVSLPSKNLTKLLLTYLHHAVAHAQLSLCQSLPMSVPSAPASTFREYGLSKLTNTNVSVQRQPYLDSDMQSRWFEFGGDTIIRADQYAMLRSTSHDS